MDGSPFAAAAATFAIDLAKRRGIELIGLGVLDAPSITRPELMPPGGMAYKQRRDKILVAAAHRRIQNILRDLGRRCRRAAVRYSLIEEVGVSHERIVLEAERADLVLFGRETHFEFATQAAPDETLGHVLRRSPRPIMVVPREPRPGRGCLIAYGGGREVARTVEAFVLLGLSEGEPVDVVTFHADRREGRRRLERVGAYLGAHGIRARLHPIVSQKPPAEAILAEVHRRRPRLLVMGAHGHHPVRDLFFTSVTRAVLKDSPIPVLAGA